jgi:hypothetical protein
MKLLDLLENIRKRPLMYLLTEDVDALHIFLREHFWRSVDSNDDFAMLFQSEFDEWLSRRYNIDNGIYQWHEILKLRTNGNQINAFIQFFENVNEFEREKWEDVILKEYSSIIDHIEDYALKKNDDPQIQYHLYNLKYGTFAIFEDINHYDLLMKRLLEKGIKIISDDALKKVLEEFTPERRRLLSMDPDFELRPRRKKK